ncbi:MAG: polyprenyl synthetase family protein, partial [Pseudomonadota bacterium]
LIHCASLVHDEMPCFDDASLRRGKPSVHIAYGQRLAVLCGDALIVMAFESLARGAQHSPATLPALIGVLGRSASVPTGIVAGQAWECEPDVRLERYQQQKTGALFVAATQLGAAAAGVDPTPWARLGERIGAAYQIADDILDVAGSADDTGKTAGRDAARLNPNAVLELGMSAAEERLRRLVGAAVEAIPACPGKAALTETIAAEARALMATAHTCHVAA